MANDKLEHIISEVNKIRADFNTKLDDIIAKLNEVIEQRKDIESSISYTSQLQKALLPNVNNLKDFFEEYFILYKPKDKVCGDFYWMTNKNDKLFLAIADCTGHGIPGAFISMMGISFLNQILNNERLLIPNLILNRLRYNMVVSLHQKNLPNEHKDGIDIAIISVDRKNNILEFSGANRSIYIIRNNEIIELKGDRMPIAINNNIDPFTHTYFEFTKLGKPFLTNQDELYPFTNHKLELFPNDCIYLFSDGYADQFGEKTNKKFKLNNLRDLLLKVHHEPMNIQSKILDQTHEKWKGNLEQVDDISVVGLKI